MNGYDDKWIDMFEKLFENEIAEGVRQAENEKLEEYQFGFDESSENASNEDK